MKYFYVWVRLFRVKDERDLRTIDLIVVFLGRSSRFYGPGVSLGRWFRPVFCLGGLPRCPVDRFGRQSDQTGTFFAQAKGVIQRFERGSKWKAVRFDEQRRVSSLASSW